MTTRVGSARLVQATSFLFLLLMLVTAGVSASPETPAAPPHLSDTGLYTDFGRLKIDPRHLAFAPQYPLWTDGAAKRRWLSLPPGTAIDGSDADDWVFPIGTRFWKEFRFNGHPVETRYLERLADGSWLYAAYAWTKDGRAAELVPLRGRRDVHDLEGGRSHDIPSISDCRVCHQAGSTPVLGFSALQLSPDRDPHGLHRDVPAEGEIDLKVLMDRGLLVGFPESQNAPRIVAASATERTMLGYLHGNCGHCHDDGSKLKKLGLFLRHASNAAIPPGVTSTINQRIRKPAPGQSRHAVFRIEPGHPERSGLVERTASRAAALQMPPLGTELVDEEAVALIHRWIAELESVQNQPQQGQGDQ